MEKNDCYWGGNKSVLHTLLQSFGFIFTLSQGKLDANFSPVT